MSEIVRAPEGTIVIFVLGGPGSGKGTQCNKIVEDFGFVHLSAGDLLREEQRNPNSKDGDLIKSYIKDGQIVPMEITVKLLSKKMQESKSNIFLIDGFPRKLDQAEYFALSLHRHLRYLESDASNIHTSQLYVFDPNVVEPCLILFLDCDKEVMKQRLLKRGETSGRIDDNIETIEKRFKVFKEESLPVVERYEKEEKVRKIPCNESVDEVYLKIRPIIEAMLAKRYKKGSIEKSEIQIGTLAYAMIP
ncbi:30940_t:CDS:2 [Gigaspora margarita]|uniref:Uridylate kinase n=1 Tax=Gigaspora margarita TaxID=4874 RepID=A0ABN7W655_GIGMA|nr:30940_t:CDS:2 [Gigaspora margarita]